jgi:peptidoglycan/LPS O-acetylase OafA/YrhL
MKLNLSDRSLKIDFLRGILCILIVFHHMPNHWFKNEQIIIFKNSLFFSVDIFFLLSGYIIYSKYFFKKNMIKSFLKNRFQRLYPMLIFSSVIFSIILFLRYNFFEISYTDQVYKFSFFQYFISFLDVIFLTSSTKIFGNLNLINTPVWSVSAEFISYFIFSIISFVNIKKTIFQILFLLLAFYLLYENKTFFSTSTYGFARCYIGFFFGGILSNYKMKIKISNFYYVTFSLTYFLLTIFFITYSKKNILNDLLIFFLIFPSFFYYMNIKFQNSLFNIIIFRIITFLGLISYSVYLNHYMIILVLNKTIHKYVNNIQLFFFTYFVVFVLSYFTYLLIEKKFRKFIIN